VLVAAHVGTLAYWGVHRCPIQHKDRLKQVAWWDALLSRSPLNHTGWPAPC